MEEAKEFTVPVSPDYDKKEHHHIYVAVARIENPEFNSATGTMHGNIRYFVNGNFYTSDTKWEPETIVRHKNGESCLLLHYCLHGAKLPPLRFRSFRSICKYLQPKKKKDREKENEIIN